MPVSGDDDIDRAEQISAHADRNKTAWEGTLEDMDAMAVEREANGWTTITIPAGHTAPEPIHAGDSDRFGLVYVIPGNKAEDFASAVERGSFPVYNVYRAETDTRVFLVTELLDSDEEIAIYIAGNYRRIDAQALIETVHEKERMFTHVQKLDKTHLASFEHDDFEKFFPVQDWRANRPDE